MVGNVSGLSGRIGATGDMEREGGACVASTIVGTDSCLLFEHW